MKFKKKKNRHNISRETHLFGMVVEDNSRSLLTLIAKFLISQWISIMK